MKLGFGHARHQEAIVWLRQSIGQDAWRLAALGIMQIGQACAGLGFAWILGMAINDAAAGRKELFFRSVLLLAALLAAAVLLSALSRAYGEDTRARMENTLRMHLVRLVDTKDFLLVESLHSGDWMTRMMSDVARVAGSVVDIVPGVAAMAVRMAGAAILLAMLLPESALLIVFGCIIFMSAATFFRRRLKEMAHLQQEALGRLRISLQEHLQSLLVIHSFLGEAWCEERAQRQMDGYRGARVRRARYAAFCSGGFALLIDVAYLAAIVYCGMRMAEGAIGYGTLVAAMELISQIQAPFAAISGYVPEYSAMLASVDRLRAFDGWPDEFASEPSGPCWEDGGFEMVRLEDVSFSYGKNAGPVLEGIDFELHRGEMRALTGPSGSGKSTLIKILMGLLEPASGNRVLAVRNGGKSESHRYGPEGRMLFSYVPQDCMLLAGTVREAVALADPLPDDSRIWNALESACAAEFVRKLPGGLDAELGEKGETLSGGQMQRLALARALYAGHPVLILDEATSALDRNLERRVLKNLKAMEGLTVLLVTHRLEAAEFCDAQTCLEDD